MPIGEQSKFDAQLAIFLEDERFPDQLDAIKQLQMKGDFLLLRLDMRNHMVGLLQRDGLEEERDFQLSFLEGAASLQLSFRSQIIQKIYTMLVAINENKKGIFVDHIQTKFPAALDHAPDNIILNELFSEAA